MNFIETVILLDLIIRNGFIIGVSGQIGWVLAEYIKLPGAVTE